MSTAVKVPVKIPVKVPAGKVPLAVPAGKNPLLLRRREQLAAEWTAELTRRAESDPAYGWATERGAEWLRRYTRERLERDVPTSRTLRWMEQVPSLAAAARRLGLETEEALRLVCRAV